MESITSFLSTAAQSVSSATASAATTVSGMTHSGYVYVSGTNVSRVRSYLHNFLHAHWEEEENPLESAVIHEEFRFLEGDASKVVGIESLLKKASRANVSYSGQIVRLIQAENLSEFFFESIATVSYGEGAKDEEGKDVSFTTKETLSFGVITLHSVDGRILKHEQRSDVSSK